MTKPDEPDKPPGLIELLKGYVELYDADDFEGVTKCFHKIEGIVREKALYEGAKDALCVYDIDSFNGRIVFRILRLCLEGREYVLVPDDGSAVDQEAERQVERIPVRKYIPLEDD